MVWTVVGAESVIRTVRHNISRMFATVSQTYVLNVSKCHIFLSRQGSVIVDFQITPTSSTINEQALKGDTEKFFGSIQESGSLGTVAVDAGYLKIINPADTGWLNIASVDMNVTFICTTDSPRFGVLFDPSSLV